MKKSKTKMQSISYEIQALHKATNSWMPISVACESHGKAVKFCDSCKEEDPKRGLRVVTITKEVTYNA